MCHMGVPEGADPKGRGDLGAKLSVLCFYLYSPIRTGSGSAFCQINPVLVVIDNQESVIIISSSASLREQWRHCASRVRRQTTLPCLQRTLRATASVPLVCRQSVLDVSRHCSAHLHHSACLRSV